MAEEPERSMLFDLRGRRKRVIQVIYVLLAIIMAASLVVIGLPGGVNPFGNSTSINQDAAEANVKRAENLQQRLAQQPNNLNLSQELIRARFSAGQSLYSLDEDTGQTQITKEASDQFGLAADAWTDYKKKAGPKTSPEVAQLMANMLFTLSQGSTVAQFENNIGDAVVAQAIVADNAMKEQKNGGGSASNQLATLAMYQLYAQQFSAAEKTRKEALASTPDKEEREQLAESLDATQKDAKRIGKMIRQAKKQAQKDGGKSLENPLGSLGSENSVGGATAAP